MKREEVTVRFVDAVNAYIELQNSKMKEYGLTEFIDKAEYVPAEKENLLTRFSDYTFPANTPHRHLYFLDEFKENAEYIAFGGNSNYNDIYAVEKQTGKVLVLLESGEPWQFCADSFESFLEAFIQLINLDIQRGKDKKIINPLSILEAVVQSAGGEEYRPFYKHIFPLSIEKMLN